MKVSVLLLIIRIMSSDISNPNIFSMISLKIGLKFSYYEPLLLKIIENIKTSIDIDIVGKYKFIRSLYFHCFMFLI